MEIVTLTRRRWLQSAAILPAALPLRAARKEFWNTKDPAAWTDAEKETVLFQSPWSQPGSVRLAEDKKEPEVGYTRSGRQGVEMPDPRPGTGPMGTPTVPIGEAPPPVPKPEHGPPIEFPVLARWETAQPVRLAGGPEVPELTGLFYVIRLRGLPLMPPKPDSDPAANSNEPLLAAIKAGSFLVRRDRPVLSCAHLFTGSGAAATEVLLFFPRDTNPITVADKLVTLECRFAFYRLSIKFPLKDMLYRGQLAL